MFSKYRNNLSLLLIGTKKTCWYKEESYWFMDCIHTKCINNKLTMRVLEARGIHYWILFFFWIFQRVHHSFKLPKSFQFFRKLLSLFQCNKIQMQALHKGKFYLLVLANEHLLVMIKPVKLKIVLSLFISL